MREEKNKRHISLNDTNDKFSIVNVFFWKKYDAIKNWNYLRLRDKMRRQEKKMVCRMHIGLITPDCMDCDFWSKVESGQKSNHSEVYTIVTIEQYNFYLYNYFIAWS